MGLHVDLDLISKDNAAKAGHRKYGCVLINDGDKITKARKAELLKINQEKYGLTQEYIDYLKLPDASNVKVYNIDKILNSRRKLSTSEKIQHLEDLRNALVKKLNILNSGGIIKDYDYLSP